MSPVLLGFYKLSPAEIGKLSIKDVNQRLYAYQWMLDRQADRDASALAVVLNSMPNFSKKKRKEIRPQMLIKGRKIGHTEPRIRDTSDV